MIGSTYGLNHRLNELLPSERDQQLARELREAATPTRTVVHTPATTRGQWLRSVRVDGQRSRLAAG